MSKSASQENCAMQLARFERQYVIRFLCRHESGPNILVREFDEYEEQAGL